MLQFKASRKELESKNLNHERRRLDLEERRFKNSVKAPKYDREEMMRRLKLEKEEKFAMINSLNTLSKKIS